MILWFSDIAGSERLYGILIAFSPLFLFITSFPSSINIRALHPTLQPSLFSAPFLVSAWAANGVSARVWRWRRSPPRLVGFFQASFSRAMRQVTFWRQ